MDILQDFYNILQVSSDASQEELKESYRKLAKKYHPDSKEASDQHMFQLVQSAWDILGDPDKRLAYDKKRDHKKWEEIRDEKLKKYQTSATVSGLARPVLKDSWSYPKVKQELKDVKPNFIDRLKTIVIDKGSDSETKIKAQTLNNDSYPEQKISLKVSPFEIWFGTKREVEIKSINNSSRKIKVKIPRGYITGSYIKVECPKTVELPEQVVQILLDIQEHELIKFDNLDIHIDLPISISEAILGNDIILTTPDKKLKIKIQPNFELGTKIKIKGMGLTQENISGDLILKPTVVAPPESDMLIKILSKLDTLYDGDLREKLSKEIDSITTF